MLKLYQNHLGYSYNINIEKLNFHKRLPNPIDPKLDWEQDGNGTEFCHEIWYSADPRLILKLIHEGYAELVDIESDSISDYYYIKMRKGY